MPALRRTPDRPPEPAAPPGRAPGRGPYKGGRDRVVRLGLSLEPALLRRLDEWVRERNSPSRSDAIRALIRKELSEQELGDPHSDAVASVLLIYRHESPNVLERLTKVEHRWGDHIRSSAHVHLEGGSCLQLIALAGERREVVAAAEELRGIRGIAYGRYVLGAPVVAGGTTGHGHPHRPGVEAARSPRGRGANGPGP